MASQTSESKRESQLWGPASKRVVIVAGGVAGMIIGKKLLEKYGVGSELRLPKKPLSADQNQVSCDNVAPSEARSQAGSQAESQADNKSDESPSPPPPPLARSLSVKVLGALSALLFGSSGKSSVSTEYSESDQDSLELKQDNWNYETCQLLIEKTIKEQTVIPSDTIRQIVYGANYRDQNFESLLQSELSMNGVENSYEIVKKIVTSKKFKILRSKMLLKVEGTQAIKFQFLGSNDYQFHGKNVIVGDISNVEEILYDGICVIIDQRHPNYSQFNKKMDRDFILVIHYLDENIAPDGPIDVLYTIPSEIVHELDLTIDQRQRVVFVQTYNLHNDKLNFVFQELFQRWHGA